MYTEIYRVIIQSYSKQLSVKLCQTGKTKASRSQKTAVLKISQVIVFWCRMNCWTIHRASRFGAVPNGGRKAIISKRTQPNDLTESTGWVCSGDISHRLVFIFMDSSLCYIDASQVVSLGQLSQMSIRLCLLQPEERAKYQTYRSKACLCTPSGHWLSCCQTAPKTCQGRWKHIDFGFKHADRCRAQSWASWPCKSPRQFSGLIFRTSVSASSRLCLRTVASCCRKRIVDWIQESLMLTFFLIQSWKESWSNGVCLQASCTQHTRESKPNLAVTLHVGSADIPVSLLNVQGNQTTSDFGLLALRCS